MKIIHKVTFKLNKTIYQNLRLKFYFLKKFTLKVLNNVCYFGNQKTFIRYKSTEVTRVLFSLIKL